MSFQVGDRVLFRDNSYYRDIYRVVMVDGKNYGIVDDKSYARWQERPAGVRWSVTVAREADLIAHEVSVTVTMTASQWKKLIQFLYSTNVDTTDTLSFLFDSLPVILDRDGDSYTDLRGND